MAIGAGATLVASPAGALDLKSDAGELPRTVAGRERERVWDARKTLGAEGMAERDRKPFRPEGLRVGNFLVFGELETRKIYEDNVFGSANDRVGDFSVQLLPTLKARSRFQRHVLNITAAGDLRKHAETGTLDRTDGYVSADAALHFNHAHTLSISVLSQLTTEDRLSPEAPVDALERGQIWRNLAAVGFTRDAGRLSATVGARYESYDFSDVTNRSGTTVDQDLRDAKIVSSDLKLAYRLSPGYGLQTRFRILRRLQRGSAVRRLDAWGYEMITGIQGELSPRFHWRFTAGYGLRDYDDGDGVGNGRILADASVRWLITQRATLSAALRRDYDETSLDRDVVRTEADAELAIEALRNLVFTLSGSYRWHDYGGADRTDRIVTAAFGFQYLHTKHVHLSGAFEHARRSSSEPGNDLWDNKVWFATKLLF